MINERYKPLNETEEDKAESEAKKFYDEVNNIASPLHVISVLEALTQIMSDVIVNISIDRGISVDDFSGLMFEDILDKSNTKFSKFNKRKVH